MDFAEVLAPLPEERVRRLREWIKDEGRILHPILVTSDGRVVDGRHRKMIADELGIECPSTVVSGTEDQLVTMAVSANVGSRAFTRAQLTALALALHDRGLSLRKISQAIGLSHEQVRRVVVSTVKTAPVTNVTPVPSPGIDDRRRMESDSRKARAIEMRGSGASLGEIQKELNVAPRTLRKYLQAAPSRPTKVEPAPELEPSAPPAVPEPSYLSSDALAFMRHALGEARSMSVVAMLARDALEAYMVPTPDYEWLKRAEEAAQEWVRYGERFTDALGSVDGARHYSGHAGRDDAGRHGLLRG